MRATRVGRWTGITVAGVMCATLGAATRPASRDETPTAVATPEGAALRADPRLEDPQPCSDSVGFTCSYLTVPLDRHGGAPGSLRLRVATADNAAAPRGTLLLLTGGPGQAGASLLPRLRERFSYLLDGYRLVMIDQRGTGAGALTCEALQAEVGTSDVTAPTPEAVRECARLLGANRGLYTTADTVADLEDLRQALSVSQWTLDGVSYGSFVAQQYGLTFPDRVHRMVLDSVVPQDGPDALYAASLRRTGWMLRQACQEQGCGFDPAAALADVVRRYGNDVGVFDLIVAASIVDPKLTGAGFFPVLKLLRKAAQGDPAPLNDAIAELQDGDGARPDRYSAGLHLATLCADLIHTPWGDSTTPLRQRDPAIDQTVRRLRTDQVWPFEPRTTTGHGVVRGCRHWPPARPNPRPPHPHLAMPVLLINGDRDLSTPLEWAVEQTARTPHGRLVTIPGMGHSIQGRNPVGDQAVRGFLLS
ncbi:alpha/beta fold hydrolase [Micromonospora sp. NBC_01638]|uniref:alpha/beta fold hydrolase n=1 Tax=Micromonospora sp. NBC_01638 TaxID=2975982 RepID=UPI0038659BEF|nr:alpha/beta hydrolase [Micromonospora sp. NBC_01638]